jgi:hypothetical protein
MRPSTGRDRRHRAGSFGRRDDRLAGHDERASRLRPTGAAAAPPREHRRCRSAPRRAAAARSRTLEGRPSSQSRRRRPIASRIAARGRSRSVTAADTRRAALVSASPTRAPALADLISPSGAAVRVQPRAEREADQRRTIDVARRHRRRPCRAPSPARRLTAADGAGVRSGSPSEAEVDERGHALGPEGATT